MKQIVISLWLVLFCGLVLTLSIRGLPGNPSADDLNSPKWQTDGPFELSPERGRYALTYSLIENKSVFFSVPIAKFAIPDLGYKNGNYVSLFAPGISFLVIPGYLLGRLFGATQVTTFAMISLFAIANVMLIRAIARRLGATHLAAILGGLTFLFATPAFAYGVDLYQHHVSTFLILVSSYLLIRFRSWWSLVLIWFLCAASIPIDYPNLFLMLPIALVALAQFVTTKRSATYVTLRFHWQYILTIFGALIPLAFFLWFNKASYNDPFQFSGTVPSVKEIDTLGYPTAPQTATKDTLEKYYNPELQHKSALSFFQTRNLLNGLYLLLISPDRGILVYTPVVLFGIIGLYILYKNKSSAVSWVSGIILIDLLLYAMWGDPWGGWAFGARYLIPSYALLAVGIGIALTHLRRKTIWLSLFSAILAYSVFVNTAGALTSSANPPQVEVIALEQVSGIPQLYTFVRNINMLKNGTSKSFVYQVIAYKYLNTTNYFLIVYSLIVLVNIGGIVLLWHFDDR